jgi:hypothetical protein
MRVRVCVCVIGGWLGGEGDVGTPFLQERKRTSCHSVESRHKSRVASATYGSQHRIGFSLTRDVREASAAALRLEVGVRARIAGCEVAFPLSRRIGHLRVSELARLAYQAAELAVGVHRALVCVDFRDGIERRFIAAGALDRCRNLIERRETAVCLHLIIGALVAALDEQQALAGCSTWIHNVARRNGIDLRRRLATFAVAFRLTRHLQRDRIGGACSIGTEVRSVYPTLYCRLLALVVEPNEIVRVGGATTRVCRIRSMLVSREGHPRGAT